MSGLIARRGFTLPPVPVLRTEILSGAAVSLALIPEAIAFSLIAGVDPKYGLYSSFIIAVIVGIAGGRPAMISAATGAMSLVVVGLVKDHGVEYLLAATILSGLIQVAIAYGGAARLMRFVPRSVTTGFVNALGILLFTSQIPDLVDGGVTGVALVGAGLILLVTIPKLTKAFPAPLAVIAVLTAAVAFLGVDTPDVGDKGELPSALPILGLPSVPLTIDTLMTILPYSLTLCAVATVESLMIARIVDDITETRSDKDREARGQGIANIVTGMFGGMAGCGMIGQTMMNVRINGARTRLSTISAGFFVIILCLGFAPLVAAIPMAAVVAVMIVVAYSTFDWSSVAPATLRRMPLGETAAMVATVAVTVATHNLAIGVGVGVLVSMVMFARRAARLVKVKRRLDEHEGVARYQVSGEVFFASEEELIESFVYSGDPERVVIDFSGAHLWDASAVAALDAITRHYRRHGITPEFIGMNRPSAELHRSLSGKLATVNGTH